MRGLHRATFRASLKLLRREGMVRTAHAGPRIRLFAFGNTHDRYLDTVRFIRRFAIYEDPLAYD